MRILWSKWYVGFHVWKLLEQPISFQQIVSVVCSEYEVEETFCLNDKRVFVNELVQKGLILVA